MGAADVITPSMKTRPLIASLALLLSACGGGDGASEDAVSRESAVEVASRPFTIGNDVADQMGTHVGEMGTDREGDPSLNALATEPEADTGPDAAGNAADQTPESNSQFTTEGGPEG
jgi:hypothetical protein